MPNNFNKQKIGIGIIGTGDIAGHHVKCVHELENCELIALASSSNERAQKAQNKYGILTYPDNYELLENRDLHAVIICTRSGNHMDVAIAAALAGKHLLVEKPLEITFERAERMITVCRENSVLLSCIFQNRFSPDFIRLKNAVSAGKFGKLFLGNAYIQWYRSEEYYQSSPWKGTLKGDGGAALINQGIHTIDLLLDLMGEVESVFGKIRTVTHSIEGEDLGLGLVTFKNGALGSIQASTTIHPGYPERLEIYGDKGSAIMEAGKIIHWHVKGKEGKVSTAKSELPSGSSDPLAIGYELHKAQVNDFVLSIINNSKPLITGEEGLNALNLILKIYESSKTGTEIYI